LGSISGFSNPEFSKSLASVELQLSGTKQESKTYTGKDQVQSKSLE
jgi:hypothetical protein